jgi:hypothetical protein
MLSKIYKFIKNFINNHFWVLLIFIVLVSYGQMLWMQPWEDDNALFVKLASIEDRVGFFGKGPLGEGVYRFAAVPFILIYKIFGTFIPAYFALLLILYVLATLTVYKVLSNTIGETGGRVVGFIYACGYITSDSFWRMANSATTSISIILISLFTLFYWQYYKQQKIKYYLLSLVFFLTATIIAVSRTHYLVAVAIIFEFTFFTFRNFPKNVIKSILRLIPFLYIFSNLVLSSSDSRTDGVGNYVTSILKGKLYLTYGFFSSISNLFIPDYLINFLFDIQNKMTVFLQAKIPVAYLLLFGVFTISILLIIKGLKNKKYLSILFYSIFLIWFFVSKKVFLKSSLGLGEKSIFVGILGGVILILLSAFFIILRKNRQIFLFFISWLVINLLAYTSYFPTVTYETINRYLAHSFFSLTCVLGILYISLSDKSRKNLLIKLIIILFGIVNLINAVIYQNKILHTRSFPVRSFYQQLSILLPEIKKDDVLYFDVSNDSQRLFRDAISAAMIPDTGSFGWRYQIYRYDFSLETDFSNLYKKITEEKVKIENIHAFWYSKGVLTDVTGNIQNYFLNKNSYYYAQYNLEKTSEAIINRNKDKTLWLQPELIADIKSPIESYAPIECGITLVASPLKTSRLLFPLYWELSNDKTKNVFNDPVQKKLALLYKKDMDNFVKYSRFNTSSQWSDRVTENLYDNDINTVWQSDRVLWQDKREYLEVLLPTVQNINRIFWIPPSYQASVPTNYEIEISLDGKSWSKIKTITNKEITSQIQQEVKFEPITTRYVKMIVTETLGGDSPMISEFRVLPSSLSALDLRNVDTYLQKPYSFIENEQIFKNTLTSFGRTGVAQLYYLANKDNVWITTSKLNIGIIYDGKSHYYKVNFPAGGTRIENIKVSNFAVPGTITLYNIECKTN